MFCQHKKSPRLASLFSEVERRGVGVVTGNKIKDFILTENAVYYMDHLKAPGFIF